MSKQYTYQEDEPSMLKEDMMVYSQGVTIPISLPSIGNYSVEHLKSELTAFALRLIHRSTQIQIEQRAEQVPAKSKEHSAWVQSMAKYRRLAPMDSKEAMLESLDERF